MVVREADFQDAPGIARVHVASWLTTYMGIIPDSYLSNLSCAGREKMWQGVLGAGTQKKEYVFVAESAEKNIAGFASCGPEREGSDFFKGELYGIYLLKECQGRGLGRILVRRAVKQLLDIDIDTMLIWVLQDNLGAVRFYEKLGGRKVKEKTVNIGGADLVEVAYGWYDIGDIIS